MAKNDHIFRFSKMAQSSQNVAKWQQNHFRNIGKKSKIEKAKNGIQKNDEKVPKNTIKPHSNLHFFCSSVMKFSISENFLPGVVKLRVQLRRKRLLRTHRGELVKWTVEAVEVFWPEFLSGAYRQHIHVVFGRETNRKCCYWRRSNRPASLSWFRSSVAWFITSAFYLFWNEIFFESRIGPNDWWIFI